MITTTLENNIATIRYKNLVVHALIGTSPHNLDQLIKTKEIQVERGNLRTEGKRSFLALFAHNPSIDLTVARDHTSTTSIVSYSLDLQASRSHVEKARCDLDIKATQDESFIATIALEIDMVERGTYDQCQRIARLAQTTLESAFGAIRYANFLQRYRQLSPKNAQEAAFDRYLPHLRRP